MYRLSRTIVRRLPLAALCVSLTSAWLPAQISVRTVKVLGAKDAVEIEVESSERVVPQTQVLTGPDRLVVDFPNSVPSSLLRSQSVDRGEVKDVRVGLFQGKPPVTRIVLDLKTAQSYQVFPSGRTVIIKVMGGGAADPSAEPENLPAQSTARAGLVAANYKPHSEPVNIEPVKPRLEVTFRNGLLGIKADKATLSEVLFAVQERTGAQVSIAAGAEQEQVVADIPPAPAAEVLARLLNGSKFNFLILSAENDPQRLDRVILSARADGGVMPLPPVQNDPVDDGDMANAQPQAVPPPPDPRFADQEMKPVPDNNAPPQ